MCNRRRCRCNMNTCPIRSQRSCLYETLNTNAFPENYLYGHAYTPVQNISKTFTPEDGLQNGTLFPELVSPYCPGQSIDFIEYLRNGGM